MKPYDYVLNIKGLHYQVAMKWGPENKSLEQVFSALVDGFKIKIINGFFIYHIYINEYRLDFHSL